MADGEPPPAGSLSPRGREERGGLAIVGLVLDVRAIAKLPHELVELLVAFALPNGLARLLAAAFLRDVLLAPLEHLDQVPAEGRADRLRELVHCELVHRMLEIGHGVARRQPTEITAFRA